MRVLGFGDHQSVHPGSIEKFNALLATPGGEIVLKTSAVQLIAGSGWEIAPPDFKPIFDPARAEEKPKAELGKLRLTKVLLQPQGMGEVSRGQLHRRFAHLMGGLGDGKSRLLQHSDPELRSFPLEL